MKKYCECFQASIPCSDLCKCADWYKVLQISKDSHNTKEYYEANKKRVGGSNGLEKMKQEDVPDTNSFFCNNKLV